MSAMRTKLTFGAGAKAQLPYVGSRHSTTLGLQVVNAVVLVAQSVHNGIFIYGDTRAGMGIDPHWPGD